MASILQGLLSLIEKVDNMNARAVASVGFSKKGARRQSRTISCRASIMATPKNKIRVDDCVAETPESITARLEGAKTSQAQIRRTLGMMAVVSMMMLIPSYNAYLSYDYNWIVESHTRQLEIDKRRAEQATSPATTEPRPAAERVAEVLTDQALKDWAASRTVLSSLIGIRVSIDDAAVLGSAVLCLLSLWLVLGARRENHTIYSLLRDTDTPGQPWGNRGSSGLQLTRNRRDTFSGGERCRIFHTIISNSLFFTFQPFDNQDLSKAKVATRFKRWLNTIGLRLVRSFFFLFPVIASFTVFCLDRWSYFVPDPFDPNFAIPGIGPFFWWSTVVFFLCWLPVTICCWKARRFSISTETELREYGNKLRAKVYIPHIASGAAPIHKSSEGTNHHAQGGYRRLGRISC